MNSRLGSRYDMLVVIEHAPKARTEDRWLCRCDCGQPEMVTGKKLDNGKIDCGCRHLEKLGVKRFRHGHSLRGKTSGAYRSWSSMKNRCQNPNNPAWPRYGGRGIIVCERWQQFPPFLQDMGERPEKTSIHRVNNNGNYEPKNCIWATSIEQRANHKPVLPVKLDGITMPALYASRLLKVPQRTFYTWVYRYGAARAVQRGKLRLRTSAQ